jgi:hypothetical protein
MPKHESNNNKLLLSKIESLELSFNKFIEVKQHESELIKSLNEKIETLELENTKLKKQILDQSNELKKLDLNMYYLENYYPN